MKISLKWEEEDWMQFKMMMQPKGAEVIYDTDDDNVPLRPKLPVENQMLEMKGDQPAKRSTTNIYKQVT